MTPAPPPPPAGRADARRNRELVLRTAMRVFAEEGTEISLARIARSAGVGAGTVYRHFPGKEILLEAVFAEHVESLAVAADRWRTRAAPGEALFGFLLEAVEKSVGRHHLCDALTADRGWPRAALTAAVHRFHQSLARLLHEAKQADAIRADIRLDDLSALTVAAATLHTAHPDPTRAPHLTRLLLTSLRPAPVTEPPEFRDTPPPPRHGTRCTECGAPLHVHPTGRPPRYCTPACRQRAHRRRRRQNPS